MFFIVFDKHFWLFAFALIFILIATTVVLFRLRIRRFSASLPVALIIFMGFASWYYFSGEEDALSELFWFIPFILTLPVSLLVWAIGPSSISVRAVVLLLTALGAAEYWAIGWMIDRLIARRRSCAKKEESGTRLNI